LKVDDSKRLRHFHTSERFVISNIWKKETSFYGKHYFNSMKKAGFYLIAAMFLFASCQQNNESPGNSRNQKLSNQDSLYVAEQSALIVHHFDVTGDLSEAKHHIDSIKNRLVSIGSDRSTDMSSILNLEAVYWLRKFNDRDTAITILEDALCIAEEELGEGHIELSSMLVNLGYMYREVSKFDTAEYYMERALAGFEKDTVKYAENIAKTLLNIAKLYSYKEKYEEALPLMYRAESIAVRNFGQSSPLATLVYSHFASTYSEMELHERALDYRQRAVKAYENQNPQNPLDLASAYNGMGLILSDMGQHSEALKEYQKAEQQFVQAYGLESPRMATLWDNMAYVYEQLGDYQKSIEMHEQAQALELQHFDANDKRIATGRRLLARAYNRVGKHEQALNQFVLAKEVREQLFGTYSDHVASDHRSISETYRMMGKMDLAYSHLDTFSIIRDSILTISRIQSLAEMSEKYEADKKEQQNQLLQLKVSRHNRTVIGIGIILLLTIMVSIALAVARKRDRKRHEAEVRSLLSEIELFKMKRNQLQDGILKPSVDYLDFEALNAQLEDELDERDMEVIRVWFEDYGLSRKETAASLFIGDNALKTRMNKIRDKLGVSGKEAAVKKIMGMLGGK